MSLLLFFKYFFCSHYVFFVLFINDSKFYQHKAINIKLCIRVSAASFLLVHWFRLQILLSTGKCPFRAFLGYSFVSFYGIKSSVTLS
jgi:hypothetical protein